MLLPTQERLKLEIKRHESSLIITDAYLENKSTFF